MVVMAEQSKRESKRVARSPRSGAEIPCGKDNPHAFKPGESGNPEGSSAKQRAKAALEKVAKSPRLEAMLDRLFEIASGDGKGRSKDTDAIQAARLASQLVGLAGGDQDALPVDVRISFRRRASGDEAELEVEAQEAGKKEIDL